MFWLVCALRRACDLLRAVGWTYIYAALELWEPVTQARVCASEEAYRETCQQQEAMLLGCTESHDACQSCACPSRIEAWGVLRPPRLFLSERTWLEVRAVPGP